MAREKVRVRRAWMPGPMVMLATGLSFVPFTTMRFARVGTVMEEGGSGTDLRCTHAVRERERDRERDSVCVCVCERERVRDRYRERHTH